MLSVQTASHLPRTMSTPILATKKKNCLHFLTRASFTEVPAKTESMQRLSDIYKSSLAQHSVFYFRPVFFSGSADLLYVKPKDSDNNLTSHFLELLPDIIIQDNRKATHILFMNVNL